MVRDGEQLSRLISSSAGVKINAKIITYLIVKLCYTGGDMALVGLCDMMDKLIDSTDTPTCIQEIRHGMYVHSYSF